MQISTELNKTMRSFKWLKYCRSIACPNDAPDTGRRHDHKGFAGDEAEDASPDLVDPPECVSLAPPAFALASPSPDWAMRGRRPEGRSLLSSLS
jgi:hypothetical protein